jgi:hypothetical protein
MAMDITLIVRTLTPVVEVLEQLGIAYHIGGSVASSLYGEFRPTQDVDIVADLQLAQVGSFVKLLEGDYYIVEDAVRDALGRRSSFNLISNETFMKVDVFLPKSRAFDQDAVRSLRQRLLGPAGQLPGQERAAVLLAYVIFYDQRGGGVETSLVAKTEPDNPLASTSIIFFRTRVDGSTEEFP